MTGPSEQSPEKAEWSKAWRIINTAIAGAVTVGVLEAVSHGLFWLLGWMSGERGLYDLLHPLVAWAGAILYLVLLSQHVILFVAEKGLDVYQKLKGMAKEPSKQPPGGDND